MLPYLEQNAIFQAGMTVGTGKYAHNGTVNGGTLQTKAFRPRLRLSVRSDELDYGGRTDQWGLGWWGLCGQLRTVRPQPALGDLLDRTGDVDFDVHAREHSCGYVEHRCVRRENRRAEQPVRVRVQAHLPGNSCSTQGACT